MDTKALRTLTYGLYLVSAVDEEGRRVGCVVNTGMQATSRPYRVTLTINHDNVTYNAIKRTRRFAVATLGQDADMELIGAFGFAHSDETDKFARFSTDTTANGLTYVTDHVLSVVECEVVTSMDAGSHEVFLGDVTDAKTLRPGGTPLTYAYYHEVLRGTTPSAASAFIGDASPAPKDARRAPAGVPAPKDEPAPQPEGPLHHFKCMLCGYVHETPLEELPADFRCPRCGAAADMFEKRD